MTTTHQSSIPCPNCGSWYRNSDKCNMCGIVVEEPIVEEKSHCNIGSLTGGRLWSKNLKRYLTEKEIKSGMKGG